MPGHDLRDLLRGHIRRGCQRRPFRRFDQHVKIADLIVSRGRKFFPTIANSGTMLRINSPHSASMALADAAMAHFNITV